MTELVTPGSPATESQAQAGSPPTSRSYRPHLQWRERAYWLTLGLVALIAIGSPHTPWFLTVNSHMVLEVVATTVALLVGCLALARHLSRRSGRFFFIGVGFLGTAFFDATHTVVSMADAAQELSSAFGSVTLWSWLVSRVFLALLLLLAAIRIHSTPPTTVHADRGQEWPIFVSVVVLVGLCFVIFQTAPLPKFIYEEGIINQPLELIPMTLFLLAFAILYRSRTWQESAFIHWLVLALVVNFAVDGLLLLFTDKLFNSQTVVAHWLKIGGYGLVFIGLVHSMAELVYQAEATAEALEITNRELERQIEERRQAETQLRTSELRLADAQRLARMGYWEYDPHTSRLTLSTELSTILGLAPQPNTLALADMVKLVAAGDRATLRDALRNAAESLTPFDLEIEITRPAADSIHLYILGNVVGDSAGQAVRLWGTGQDVTERHRTEEQLRSIATRLEASNRELQDFAYIASHDLQEPLRKIIAFSDRLSLKFGDVLDETGHDYLQRVQHAARRMQVLIEDLLTLSRVTTRGQPFVKVDLNEVVRDVAVDLETRLEESNGQLEIGPLPVIEADPLQMRQLFQNLIGNALKFHRAGVAPKVRIYALSDCDGDEAGSQAGEEEAIDRHSVEHEPTEHMPDPDSDHDTDHDSDHDGDHYTGRTDRYTIVVEDNGIGFDNKYAERIFQPFQRLHGRSSEYAGTGMGLAICRKIVERHHGVIAATGETDQGAKFMVTLPKTQLI